MAIFTTSSRYIVSLATASFLILTGCPAQRAVHEAAGATTLAPTPTISPDPRVAPLDAVPTPPGTFFTTPYLQLGDSGTDAASLAVAWHVSGLTPRRWGVETRSPAGTGAWVPQPAPVRANRVAVGVVEPHTVCMAPLVGLTPGQPFDYRISRDGKPVFAARANRARPGPAQDFRIVIFGDCAEDTAWQKKVAYQTSLLKPDAVLITGDIVYPNGRASEYRSHYFPVYAAAKADPRVGAPLLSSTLFIGASGNHDLEYSNLRRYPDGLAYYYYWKQPLNGWGSAKGSDKPRVSDASQAFEAASSGAYPHGANFSFDYGNAHFVVIDSNYYMNWRDMGLVTELKKAITANPSATWRFVVFHIPPFHSSQKHQEEQWMRRIVPVLEECGVDVVWSGHVHNYQRTHPLRFAPKPDGGTSNTVDGTFSIDGKWDGVKNTRPDGVIYVVTGAGGAALYAKRNAPRLAPYTAKYDAGIHSLTELSVRGKTLSVRQVDENGAEVDRWSVTK